MLRPCTDADNTTICAIINDAARAYQGLIPADRWHEPYMPLAALQAEVAAGVTFWGYVEDGELIGVMGSQAVCDVTLIRHAYVRTDRRRGGIGGHLLAHLLARATTPVLIGTWAAAEWAIRFYECHGFRQVSPAEKDRLLRAYWTIPDRQIETSVVLADAGWFAQAAAQR
jgi:GNAT superfamily N-acetyltransferase